MKEKILVYEALAILLVAILDFVLVIHGASGAIVLNDINQRIAHLALFAVSIIHLRTLYWLNV